MNLRQTCTTRSPVSKTTKPSSRDKGLHIFLSSHLWLENLGEGIETPGNRRNRCRLSTVSLAPDSPDKPCVHWVLGLESPQESSRGVTRQMLPSDMRLTVPSCDSDPGRKEADERVQMHAGPFNPPGAGAQYLKASDRDIPPSSPLFSCISVWGSLQEQASPQGQSQFSLFRESALNLVWSAQQEDH